MADKLKQYEYYKTDQGTLYCGDCLEIMPYFEDDYFDLCLTDPPYNLEWKQSIELHGRKALYGHKVQTEKWDNISPKYYNTIFKFFDSLIKHIGSVLIFTRSEYITWAVEGAKENNFDNKATIVWHKTNPIPQIRKKNYLSSIETILWVARYDEKKCPFIFNFQTQKAMHNFFEYPLCGGDERTEHPTQKPLNLIEKLVTIHSDENNIIIDPFSGSGTLGVACEKLNRRWVGIEISEKYCRIARKRIDKEARQGKFNL